MGRKRDNLFVTKKICTANLKKNRNSGHSFWKFCCLKISFEGGKKSVNFLQKV